MAINNLDEITRLANLLAAQSKLKFDYDMFMNKQRKLLIVEGSTDEEFIKQVKEDCVDCIVADHVFNSNNKFRTTAVENVNCKNAIVKIIYSISHIPSSFLKYPEKIDKWDIYGMVDLDYDNTCESKPTPRLFVTDTHDLETLLLSTDENILTRLKECKITPEDVQKAYYIAYQLGVTRKILYDYQDDLNLSIISGTTCPLDFSLFLANDKIDLFGLMKYINSHSENSMSAKKLKKTFDSITGHKETKKRFLMNGIWKQNIEQFVTSKPLNFWEVVNGHDILQLIQYFNATAFSAFNDQKDRKANRNFEWCLINNYDYSNFPKTKIYIKMKQSSVVK